MESLCRASRLTDTESVREGGREGGRERERERERISGETSLPLTLLKERKEIRRSWTGEVSYPGVAEHFREAKMDAGPHPFLTVIRFAGTVGKYGR